MHGSGRWCVFQSAPQCCVAPDVSPLNDAAMAVCPQEGTSTVTVESQDFTLAAGDSLLIPEQKQ